MKVKEFKEILDKFNENADIFICYNAYKKDSKKHQCFYAPVENINYNQYLQNNKIVVDEKKLLIWGE